LDFLNQLTAAQAATLRGLFPLVSGQPGNFAGTTGAITGTHPHLANAQPWRAATHAASGSPAYSGWPVYFAYVDWAGLRPFTEMEYEKACRGPILPQARDYPWGLAVRHLVNRFDNKNTPEETATLPDANLLAA